MFYGNLLMHLAVVTMLCVLATATDDDDCTDIHNDKSNKGWKYIEKLKGKKLNVKKEGLNSTYMIGVCANVLPQNYSEHAGAIEKTQDNQTIVIGRYDSSELLSGSYWILLKYFNGEPYDNICSNSKRHAAIMFVCDHGVQEFKKAIIVDENLGREKDCYHLFEVEHCVACISDGCNAFFHRYSPGTIILLGLGSLIVAYLLFGWIFTRFIRRKRGWRQIPNALFWQEIGHLQADGCNMVCRCGKRKEDDYNLISGDSTMNNPNSSSLFDHEDEIMLPP